MRSGTIAALCLAHLAVAAWLAGCVGPTRRAPAAGEGRWSCTFEDGTPQGWEGTGGGSVRVADEHPAGGRRSLRADLAPGPYPGIGIDFKTPQDWSKCQAFRFRVFNATGGPVAVCVRVDDADSKDFSTRYNNDMDPHKLAPGDNEVEVPIAALRQGGFLSRGLNVDRIRTIRVFSIGTKNPITLFFDDFHLVAEKRSGPNVLPVVRLGGSPPKWSARDGAVAKIPQTYQNLEVELPTGEHTLVTITRPGQVLLELELPAGSAYPGVSLPVTERNWLSYDLLVFEATCPPDAPSPQSIDLKIMDSVGRSQTVTCPLKKGVNPIVIPLEMASSLSLGRVSELVIFAAKPPAKEMLRLSPPFLRRIKLVEHPTVRDAKAADPALTLDMTDFKVPRNTCFLATVYIPLADGRTRVVRCNSPNRGELKYALGSDAFAGAAPGKPVQVWLYVSDHGSWCWWQRSVAYEGKPLVVRFEWSPQ